MIAAETSKDSNEWVSAYFNTLLEHRQSAACVDKKAVVFADGSSPQANCCHANTDRYVEERPDSTAVRGWLILANGPQCLFTAHSVVSSETGQWFDISLPEESTLPFLQHVGDEQAFMTLAKGDYGDVWWPPLAIEMYSALLSPDEYHRPIL